MKTLNIFFTAFFLFAFIHFSQAARQNDSKEKITINHAITGFINAYCHGKVKGFDRLLDDHVKATITRGNKVISLNKSEIMESLKSGANVEQNCKTSYSITESIPNQTVVKVVMKYETFTKETYVTLTESDEGWMITHISGGYQ